MDPYTLDILLREYHRVRADEDRRKQRRLDAALDANEVMDERVPQGQFTVMLSQLRERWPRLSPRASRPMEPSGV